MSQSSQKYIPSVDGGDFPIRDQGYIQFKLARFKYKIFLIYLLGLVGAAYLTNSLSYASGSSISFLLTSISFLVGIVAAVGAVLLGASSSIYMHVGSTSWLGQSYSVGAGLIDASIVVTQWSLSTALFLRCQAGPCGDGESASVCNPQDEVDAFPSGHVQTLLGAVLLGPLFARSLSPVAAALGWAGVTAGLLSAAIKFCSMEGTRLSLVHCAIVLLAIGGIEHMSWELYINQLVGQPASSPYADTEANETRSKSDKMRLSGVPYLFLQDLCSPVKFLNGLLSSSVDSSEPDSQGMARISASNIRDMKVCSGLLAMQINMACDLIRSRLGETLKPKSQRVNVSQVVQDAVLLATYMQKSVKVTLQPIPKVFTENVVGGDSDWLFESVFCLLCNAIRMNSASSSVNVIVDYTEPSERSSRAFLRVVVDSDGVGAENFKLTDPNELFSQWSQFIEGEAAPKLYINGAAGICIEAVRMRAASLSGSCVAHLGRAIRNQKDSQAPGGSTKGSMKGPGDKPLSVASAGGCRFILSLPCGLHPIVAVEREKGLRRQKSFAAVFTRSTSGRMVSESAENHQLGKQVSFTKLKTHEGEHYDRDRAQVSVVPSVVRSSDTLAKDVLVKPTGTFSVSGDSKGEVRVAPAEAAGDESPNSPKRKQVEMGSPGGKKSSGPRRRRHRRYSSSSDSDTDDSQSSDRSDDDFSDESRGRPERNDRRRGGRRSRHHRHSKGRRARQSPLDVIGAPFPQPEVYNKYPPPEVSVSSSPHKSVFHLADSQAEQRNASQYHGKVAGSPSVFANVTDNLGQNMYSQQPEVHLDSDQLHVSNEKEHGDFSIDIVSEAIALLSKAKQKASAALRDGTVVTSSPARSYDRRSNFVVSDKVKLQTVLLVIPTNVADYARAGDQLISGLKAAGKSVQVERSLVNALNILTSGISFDAAVLDISRRNGVDVAEFMRRLRSWEQSVGPHRRSVHQFVVGMTLDDVAIQADAELHAGIDTMMPTPVRVAALIDILNIVKILTV
jgi:hypothetical protein